MELMEEEPQKQNKLKRRSTITMSKGRGFLVRWILYAKEFDNNEESLQVFGRFTSGFLFICVHRQKEKPIIPCLENQCITLCENESPHNVIPSHIYLKLRTPCGEGLHILRLTINTNANNPPVQSSTYRHLLHTCIAKKIVSEGKEIHSHINDSDRIFPFSIPAFLQNALINVYDKCRSLVDARTVLDRMSEPDMCSWNMIIAAYQRHGLPQHAFNLFHQMQHTGVQPNQFTFSSIIPTCTSVASLIHGLQIHAKIIRYGYQSKVIVMNALVDMYCKCGNIRIARRVFDQMPKRDVFSWTAMIAGYWMQGKGEDAIALISQMQVSGMQLDDVSFLALLSACSHSGLVSEGWKYFEKMREHGLQKNPGWSRIEVKNLIHVFHVGDMEWLYA